MCSSTGSADVPTEAGFALVIEVDGSEEDARAQRDELIGVLGGAALAVDEIEDTDALWRWRDGINGVVSAERGAKVSEDVVFPLERLGEGLDRFEAIAAEHGLRSCVWGHGGEGNVHATVMVDPEVEAELDAAEAVGEQLFELVVALGGSVAGEHGVGWLKRGRLAAQWDRAGGSPARGDQAGVRPQGPLEPSEEAGKVACPSPVN